MALCSAIAFHWLGVRWYGDDILISTFANISKMAYLHYPKICGWHNLITYCIHIIHLNDMLHRQSDSQKKNDLVLAIVWTWARPDDWISILSWWFLFFVYFFGFQLYGGSSFYRQLHLNNTPIAFDKQSFFQIRPIVQHWTVDTHSK